jgi:hypothetical protein
MVDSAVRLTAYCQPLVSFLPARSRPRVPDIPGLGPGRKMTIESWTIREREWAESTAVPNATRRSTLDEAPAELVELDRRSASASDSIDPQRTPGVITSEKDETPGL